MHRLQNNRLALEAHLDELNEIINLNEFIPKAKAFLPPILNWGVMSVEQKGLVNDLLKKKVNINRTLYNSLFISAVASFESFLSQIIEITIHLLNEKFKAFTAYSSVFINRQIEFSGKILSSIYNPPNHINIDFYKICKNAGTIFPESTNVSLNPEISAYFRNILEMESFSKFFLDLDISISIEELSKLEEIKALFDSKGQKETFKQLDQFLKETIKLRNRIAHTGQSASDIDRENICNLIKKLSVIAESITRILENNFKLLFKLK